VGLSENDVYGIPPNEHFSKENDDAAMDLGLPYFQTPICCAEIILCFFLFFFHLCLDLVNDVKNQCDKLNCSSHTHTFTYPTEHDCLRESQIQPRHSTDISLLYINIY
jgi:hypothetical protein